ncbi:MAG: hypothetical protein ACHQF3_05650 [Alphaproteobacteria bacterium]
MEDPHPDRAFVNGNAGRSALRRPAPLKPERVAVRLRAPSLRPAHDWFALLESKIPVIEGNIHAILLEKTSFVNKRI